MTDNYIGDTGATSLSEALKTNTTLTKLYLWGEDKKKEDIHKASIDKPLFFHSLYINRQRDWRQRGYIIE